MRCGSCKTEKPHEQFYRSAVRKSGYDCYCKSCRDEQLRERQARDENFARQVRANKASYRAKNRDRIIAQERDRRRRLRLEVLAAYGAKCACCDEGELAFLEIDHVNGRTDASGSRRGDSLYSWLRRSGFPRDGFQILCSNCNKAKGLYGVCPHQLRVEAEVLV
jgi:hypothetical protein